MSDLFLDEIVRPQGTGGPEEPEGGRGGRRAERAEREVRRRRRRRRVTVTLIVLAVVGGSGVAVATLGTSLIEDLFGGDSEVAEDYPGPGHSSVEVVIPPGATGSEMAAILFEANVVASAQAFTLAFAANTEAASIQPGTYRLMLQMKASDAVEALVNRDNRIQTRVTIPEGFQLRQILERLSSVTSIPIEDFEAAMEDTAATGLPAEAGGNYEGWLFPATYTFEPGTTATEMIATMVNQMTMVLDERGIPAGDRLRVLTIASLIEREARLDEDRPVMARAILNRLDIGMKLDIDATVAYGLGKPGMELTIQDLQTDGPYNTYMRSGLPPTPIAAPGATSIDAVLNPASGDWKFWVTVNLSSGETKFAETYEEHQRNEAELRAWQAENPTP